MLWRRRVYLDYASAAPVTWAARRAFWRASLAFGNPASPHEEGRRARAMLEQARTDIARLLEAKPDDVIFTSGATEANNLAVRGLVRPGSHVLYLPSSHASIVESVRALEGVLIEPLPIANGRIDIEKLKKMIGPATALITLEAVCGETGTVWNTRDVRTYLDTLEPNRPRLHVDASQAPLTQKLTRSHYGADLLTLDAQKVGGERGIGALIAPREIPLRPVVLGGGQERGLRSGTPAPALAAAFATALKDSVQYRDAFVEKALTLKKALIQDLQSIPRIYINEGEAVAPNILNVSLPGRDTDYLVTILDTRGFAVSTRSACETDSLEGSRAVFALTYDRERSQTTLRISWGRGTSKADLARFVAVLKESIIFLDNSMPKSHY